MQEPPATSARSHQPLAMPLLLLTRLSAFAAATAPLTSFPPLGTTAKGCCGVTDGGLHPGACDVQPKGSWNTSALGITSLAACAARCANCSQC
eukprot:COSAG01_NODE_50317_length_364_cov_0.784906_1_plen_92_part_10